jgi:4-diphosphocytidyl-2-C-methyl-D-erythritol kinase
MSALRAICPAKINLGLRVVGRREDGYHEIVTIFQTIDLVDVLEGEVAETLTLTVSGAGIPADESNLVVKAARLLQASVPKARERGARLGLFKSIPSEAGLGGGSSDAAGTLLLLNELWALRLDAATLRRLAAGLGSDVPFFLRGGTALGAGRGETISRLPPISEREVVLGTPPFGLETATVYRALAAPLTAAKADVTVPRLFLKFAEGNDFALVTNDLEAVAFRLRGELAIFKDALSRVGAEAALVSGSGSTVFGLFRAGTDVTSLIGNLRGAFPDWTLRACRTSASGVRIVPAVR